MQYQHKSRQSPKAWLSRQLTRFGVPQRKGLQVQIEPLERRILLSTDVIGSWVGGSGASNPNDGWFDWTEAGQNGGNPGADGMTYLNTNTSGATYSFVKDGNVPGNSSGYSLDVTWPGSSAVQDLALKLEYEPNWPTDVYSDDSLVVQVTVPSTTQSGYEQLFAIALNAPSPVGFDENFAGVPVAQAEWGWGSSGGAAQVDTFTISYSSILTQLAGAGYDASNPGWFELIFSTNSDGKHNSLYIDQVSLVGPSTTSSVLTSSANPSGVGQSVTFTDTVSGEGGTPTGTVNFMDGTTTLGTGTLNASGFATFTTSSLSAGSSLITAVYGGDTNFTGSTSPAVDQTVENSSPVTATANVDAIDTVRAVETQDLGVNIAEWDSDLSTSETQQMVLDTGMTIYRLPGGSESDIWQFDEGPAWNGQPTLATMAEFVQSVNGIGMVTLNYGEGSPQEAAAELAYLDGSPTSTTVIGEGEQFNTTTDTWQEVNWQTVGYWASLRAAAPLGTDDGLNFLRADHPASFNIDLFEVGNEDYGSWETDMHGSDGGSGAPHDPTTYANFVLQFNALAQEIDPNISIGVDAPGPDLSDDNGWLGKILTIFAQNDFTPGFISDHQYVENAGSESDSYLLNDTVTDTSQTSGDPTDWAQRAADYEADLTDYLGATDAAKVELMNTELNSVSGSPGKQTTSLVEGLWLAESIGSIMETPYDASIFWDLRNGWTTTGNNSSSLYGWRDGGDQGMLGTPNLNDPPETGAYVAYPTYYAEELVSHYAQAGGNVVASNNTDSLVDVYAVVESDGDLDLLVVNTDPSSTVTEQINLQYYDANGSAEVWQYGEAQDTAQSESSNGASSLENYDTFLSVVNDGFEFTVPAYSMTVIQLDPGSSGVIEPVAASPSDVGSNSTTLVATVAGATSALNYNWSIASAPAGARLPTLSDNGNNAAQSVTATFFAAGTYTFACVTSTDSNQYDVLGEATVIVSQTLTSITVTPNSPEIGLNANLALSAVALDQFGNPMLTQPAFTWSLQSGSDGSLSADGVYTSPSTNGSATAFATDGTLSGSAFIVATDTAPSKLVISEQPVVGVTNSDLLPGIEVAVVDDNGDLVTDDPSSITLQMASDPPGGVLDGTVTVNPVNGIAVFNNLAFTKSGDYTLTAGDSESWITAATSDSIQIFAGAIREFTLNGIPVSQPGIEYQEIRVIQAISPSAAILAEQSDDSLMDEHPLISELSVATPSNGGSTDPLSPAFVAAATPNSLLDAGGSGSLLSR